MFSSDLGIDLGTANTLIYMQGRGIVVNEPSIIATNAETGKLQAIGREASEMVGRTPQKINLAHPLRNGVIADFDVARNLLSSFIRRCHGIRTLFKPRIIVGVPSQITPVETRALVEAVQHAGGGKVLLVKEATAAALGAQLPIHEPRANMIVDIGAGTTEIAIISLSGIVLSRQTRVAGNQFDEAIMEHLESKHRIVIGKRTAEQIKIEVGSACPLHKPLSMEVKGKCKITGLPKKTVLTDITVREALTDPLNLIAEAVRSTMANIPPELSADVADRGILLTGGGALLRNLPTYISNRIGVAVSLDTDPLSTVARGTGSILGSPKLMACMTTLG
jgi:rod shape-determining protein MreB